MSSPRVSVVVPAYQAGRYIQESLDSILAQTYPSLEVVVVDDASNDDTGLTVQAYQASRVRYYRNERNLGQFGSLNVGIAHANGELIAIQHADDVYFPTIIERAVAFLDEHPEAAASFALDVFIDEDGREFGRVQLPPEFRGDVVLSFSDVLNGVLRYGNTFIRGGTSLVRRSVYEEVGPFDSSYDLRGDLDMWLRIASAGPIGIVDEHLTAYRWGNDHLSGRYGHLRSFPEHYFALMDKRLETGDREVATAQALIEYEAHRVEDLLMVAANLYILNRREESRSMLARAHPGRLLASRNVRRMRLFALWAAIHVLVRLPRLRFVADRFYQRWHAGTTSGSG